MVKQISALAVACIILLGSIIFPLGDLSLSRDLPDMYSNYSKVATPDEVSIIDFVGDYLLHGKEVFGHNKQDKPQNSSNNVQFQHQPTPFYVVLIPVQIPHLLMALHIVSHRIICITTITSGFKNKPFRPPLA